MPSILLSTYSQGFADRLATDWITAVPVDGAGPATSLGSLIYRFNLFRHVQPSQSIVRGRQRAPLRCYDILSTENPLQSFHVDECPSDDLFPCRWSSDGPEGASGRAHDHWRTGGSEGGQGEAGRARIPGARPPNLPRQPPVLFGGPTILN
eukprot:tig00020703_g13106.t1